MRHLVLFIITLVAVGAVAVPVPALPPSLIMPWFCLQRCGSNVTQIQSNIDNVVSLRLQGINISVVSFEKYNLGPNSTLVKNVDLFDFNDYVRRNESLRSAMPFRIAMVSSYPYPPQFLDWMRALFKNPEPFVAALVADLLLNNISGVNIDFEPTSPNATAADALQYAEWLKLMRVRLAEHGLILTVDGAGWSPIWNVPAIAHALKRSDNGSALGYFMSMGTYTYDDSTFLQNLRDTISIFRANGTLDSYVVGLETWPNKITPSQIQNHFAALRKWDICRIAIWDMPINPLMLAALKDFSLRCFR